MRARSKKGEIWKNVKGYKYYQVSNLGRVKSLTKRVIGRSCSKGRLIIPRINRYGYFELTLFKDNKKKTYRVHKLIAETFIKNPFNKKTINHISGNKLDNRIENLEWCTHLENNQHAWVNGLIKTNKNVVMLSLNNEPLLLFDSMSEVFRMSGIQTSHISECCKGKRKQASGYKWKYNKRRNLRKLKKKER